MEVLCNQRVAYLIGPAVGGPGGIGPHLQALCYCPMGFNRSGVVVGKAPEAFMRELLETALHAQGEPRPRTAREVLQAAGRIHPLSEALRRQIIPGVPLDEVRHALSQAAGPTLSAIVLEQWGPKR